MNLKFVITYYIIYLIYFLYLGVSLNNNTYLSFLNVGQGDSSIIQSRNNLVIIDGGPNYDMDSYIDNIIPFFSCNIDYVIISHPHSDHIRGINRIIKRCKVKYILYFNTKYKSKEWNLLKAEILNNQSINLQIGSSLRISDNESIDILWPPQDYYCLDINDCSLVVHYKNGDKSVLYMGDVSFSVTNKLILPTKPTIVKLPHHGADNTLSAEFLSNISPFIGVLSYGKNNNYNHPSAKTINLLKEFDNKIIKTVDGSYLVKFSY